MHFTQKIIQSIECCLICIESEKLTETQRRRVAAELSGPAQSYCYSLLGQLGSVEK